MASIQQQAIALLTTRSHPKRPWKMITRRLSAGHRMASIPVCRAVEVTVPNETRADRLDRAKGYPYARPSSSFMYINGSVFTFENELWEGPNKISDLVVTTPEGEQTSAKSVIESMNALGSLPEDSGEWTGVLAIGSNAGPEQLKRKFPLDLFPKGVVIPVVQGVLHDFDVVYAPLVSSYGSCTATLEYSPETRVSMFVTYLTNPMLERMNATEGAYHLCLLRNVELELGVSLDAWRKGKKGQKLLDSIFQYNHQNGTLHMPVEGNSVSPIALRAIDAENRKIPSLYQTQMLSAVKNIIGSQVEAANGNGTPPRCIPKQGELPGWMHDKDLDEWILRNLDDSSVRGKLVEHLGERAKQFLYEDIEIISTIGNQYSANVK